MSAGFGGSIPSIEIGSFLALEADKSEFIGSASGAFYVNTVFRAFASCRSSAPSSSAADQDDDPTTVPCLATAHNFLAGAEPSQGAPDDSGYGDDDVPFAEVPLRAEQSSYGIAAPGLGVAPSAATARKLVMLYFQSWHPLFPFLHGPTLFEQMDDFFGAPGASQGERQSHRHGHGRDVDRAASASPRSKLCRAVTFQCLFNIAACSQAEHVLEPSSRIRSVASLTNLVGYISSRHDTASLQALLAVELYLTVKMSLRAASTVHGALTRTLYHAGFHRCPHRYVQMTRPMCDIRQRIFWCAYVLDRHLSQALGHPVAMVDDEIDVCVPGQPELHQPVRWPDPEQGSSDESHFVDHESTQLGRSSLSSLSGLSPESVQGHIVTYSRLLGAALDLFHRSIHCRSVTWDKILELTSRVHSWWNGLPLALQDATDCSQPGLSPYFAMLYQYLILFMNRPFLSLPTHRAEFRSSLQSAVVASCSIVRKLRPVLERHPFLRAWPGTLSASWMAGLTIAFAALLKQIPLERATTRADPSFLEGPADHSNAHNEPAGDLDHCLELLACMSRNWISARRCHAALQMLRTQLTRSSTKGLASCPSPATSDASIEVRSEDPGTDLPRPVRMAEARETSSSKRRKHTGDAHEPPPNLVHQWHAPAAPEASEIPYWQPVLEYTGPDFGFDTGQFGHQNSFEDVPPANLTPGLLNSHDGWDAYVQSFGNHFSS